jgi:hypothetical protein
MSQSTSLNKPETGDRHDILPSDAESVSLIITEDKHDKSHIESHSYPDTAIDYQKSTVDEVVDHATKTTATLSVLKKESRSKVSDVLSVVGLQIIVLILMILLTMQYSWLHNVPHIMSPLFGNKNVDSFVDAIADYNFVGVKSATGEPSIFAVVLEVAIWSLAGVLARSEYYLSQIVIRKRQFHLLETISKLISDASMGIAIAIAVVLFLRATEFLDLSLKNANVASIAAISFILGFYHEDTRRLLGSFRRKITESAEENKDAD